MNPLTTKIVEVIKETAYDWYGTQRVIKTEDANGIHIETVQDMSMRVDESELTAAIDKVLEGEGWISVQDRLPEPYKEVLTTNGNEVRSGFYDSEFKSVQMRMKFATKPVTHWQPLPAPPK